MWEARSIDRCQTSAEGARTFLETAINEFHVRLCRVLPGGTGRSVSKTSEPNCGLVLQGRMQRCLVRCQDKAKDAMPASPSERDMRTAQVWALSMCVCKDRLVESV